MGCLNTQGDTTQIKAANINLPISIDEYKYKYNL